MEGKGRGTNNAFLERFFLTLKIIQLDLNIKLSNQTRPAQCIIINYLRSTSRNPILGD